MLITATAFTRLMDKTPARHTIQSVETVFTIIEQLEQQGPASLAVLSAELAYSKSTVHKHLKTLEAAGYVTQSDNQYSLGMRFLGLGGLVRNRDRLCFSAKEPVEKLAHETGETTTFTILQGGRGIWAYFYNDFYEMRRELHVGGTFKLHQLAQGKAMLSTLSDERIADILEDTDLSSRTDNTITDLEDLYDEVDQVRDDGFAISAGEFLDGVLAIAAPVYDQKTDSVGAIGLAGPSTDFTEQKLLDEYVDRLLEAANRLELQLRYI